MIPINRNLLLGLCLSFSIAPWQSYAQEAPKPQPPASPDVPPPARGELSTSDGLFSIAVFYWLAPTARPKMRTGREGTPATPSDLDFSKSRPIPGGIISFPVGGSNTLRISYFRAQGSGGTVASQNLNFFGTAFNQGNILSTSYTLQHAKVSLDYLSWPNPPAGSKFRFKTLWEVQFTTIGSRIRSVNAADGSIVNSVVGTNQFFYPTLGVGIENTVSRHFRWEARGSGFGLPKRSAIGDVDVFAAIQGGRVEFLIGARAFYFKTSPNREEFIRGLLSGGYVGLRWYP